LERLISLVGVFVFLGIAVLFSRNRKAIDWKMVLVGLFAQFVFAFLVLDTTPGQEFFAACGRLVGGLMDFSQEGIAFVFGKLADPGGPWSFVFAFKVLPTIIFFASLMNILDYLGILTFVVSLIAKAMMRLMGTSGAETLCASANIFMGQTEAPLLIKSYIATLTESELAVVMVSGFATIAAGVMFIYASMFENVLHAAAGHFLAASVMSAPAAILMAKVIFPEVGEPTTRGSVKLEVVKADNNVIEAAASGAGTGLNLALNVGAMLIAFISLVKLINAGIGWIPVEHIHLAPAVILGVHCSVPAGSVYLSLEWLFGHLFAPFAFLIGVPKPDILVVGDLLGKNLVINEFFAYSELLERLMAHKEIAGRSVVLSLYALCGFANLSSIGIQIGGIGVMAENRRSDLARLGFMCLLAGTLANFQTAAVANLLIRDSETQLNLPPVVAPAPASTATPAAPAATATPAPTVTPAAPTPQPTATP
jgi:CNT family concentrative nucleoside transporter